MTSIRFQPYHKSKKTVCDTDGTSAICDPDSIEEIDSAYLSEILRCYHAQPDIEVLDFTTETVKPGLHSSFGGGILRYRLKCKRSDIEEYETSLILKSGVSSDALLKAIQSFDSRMGYPKRAADLLRVHWDELCIGLHSINEINSYRTFIPELPIGSPAVYHTVLDEESERFWIFMEDITGYPLPDKWDDISAWDDDLVKSVLSDMARMHSMYWNELQTLSRYPWLNRFSAGWARSTLPFWKESVRSGLETHSGFFERSHARMLSAAVENLVDICSRLDGAVRTLVHRDFKPLNLGFKQRASEGSQGSQGSEWKVILYDWGEVSVDVPQFDLFYFINSLVDPERELDRANALIDFYLDSLPEQIRSTLAKEDFIEIYKLSVLQYLVTRELAACSVADEAKDAWMFRFLRRNLKWAELAADNYL